VLSGAYGIVVLFIWPLVIMTLLGIAETLFGLRGRISRHGPPTAPKT